MSDGVDDPHQEALGELALAALAWDEQDFEHAANHLCAALAHEPTLPEAHELLARLAARDDDGGVALFRPGRRAFIGQVVAYAHVLARRGDVVDALSLLAQATAHDPSRPWADVAWVHAVDPGRINPEHLVGVLLTVLGALPDPAPAPVAAANRAYLVLAERALTAFPRAALLHGAASGVARRMGAVPLALRWAERGAYLESGKLTEMWRANALRADGQLDAAVAAMRAAQRHDPDDLAVTSDLAIWLTEAGRPDEGLRLIEAAVRRDPTYDCAVHTAHRLRFLADGDPGHLVALADFMRAQPSGSHEHLDLDECCEALPWLGYVPPPTGAPSGPAAPLRGGGELDALLDLDWGPPPSRYDLAIRLSSLRTEDLLAVLHAAEGGDAGARRRQLWCCLGLLHHRTGEPWATSTRRRTLVDLAFGPADGAAEAALYALATAAWVDPDCRADVAELVAARFDAAASAEGGATVAQLAFITPGLDEAVRTRVWAVCAGHWPRPYTPMAHRALPAPPRRSWLDRLLRRP
ncbi:hypothetical protein Cs7R123_74690 [Catellatospora sp. TT07R-123]|uniref:tetratricopeptide repeat protein n=1 Tax=Catellatospora sp. TT07R-123 TaxID=2733863 RepID=UPI001B0BBF82|nr:tetratricopeptide repeat protein [Catellatospora sp. TT07R-123]GHJ50127.1 hypothetical protein Cs7R123_74690 [Catellatospora sp. TT07R-123]